MKPRLGIEILAREPQVNCRCPRRRAVAEGVAFPTPDHVLAAVRAQSRGVEMVGVQVGDGFGGAVEVDLGDGGAVEPDVVADEGGVIFGFGDQVAGEVVVVDGRGAADDFPGALP